MLFTISVWPSEDTEASPAKSSYSSRTSNIKTMEDEQKGDEL